MCLKSKAGEKRHISWRPCRCVDDVKAHEHLCCCASGSGRQPVAAVINDRQAPEPAPRTPAVASEKNPRAQGVLDLDRILFSTENLQRELELCARLATRCRGCVRLLLLACRPERVSARSRLLVSPGIQSDIGRVYDSLALDVNANLHPRTPPSILDCRASPQRALVFIQILAVLVPRRVQ